MQVVFYEKPGCINNTRQKQRLRQAGFNLDVRDLLAEKWNLGLLRDFLAPLPVAEWFNRAAPRVKSGEIVPERLSPSAAIRLLILDPILIRRPLIKTRHGCAVGFEPGPALKAIGIDLPALPDGMDLMACPRVDAAGCAPSAAG